MKQYILTVVVFIPYAFVLSWFIDDPLLLAVGGFIGWWTCHIISEKLRKELVAQAFVHEIDWLWPRLITRKEHQRALGLLDSELKRRKGNDQGKT